LRFVVRGASSQWLSCTQALWTLWILLRMINLVAILLF